MKKIKNKFQYRLLISGIILFLPGVLFGGNTIVSGLLCEYLHNPLGLDILNPRMSWQIQTPESNFKQTAYEIRVAESPVMFSKKDKLKWSSGKVISDQSVNIEYQGLILESGKRYYWQVRIWDNKQKSTSWSEPAWWEMAILDPTLWNANWIIDKEKSPDDHRPVYFRKEFACSKKIQSARLYISSLGLYQANLNGKKVSADLFTPGWTSYNKRLQYQVYDISDMLNSENAIGVILADGWYRGKVGWERKGNYYGDKLALLAQVEVTYSDGTIQQVVTDSSWYVSNGAIISSDIQDGEFYDARLEMPGWDCPGFTSVSWVSSKIFDYPKNTLIASRSYPVRAITEFKAQKIIITPKGETVLDLGQNIVGWVRLKVEGQKGDHVVLKFAEVLDKEGNFYTRNLRAAKATDEYILKGGGEEFFEPHFTFHGFRYVKLEKFSGIPDLNSITGISIHSDMPLTGTFVCSDKQINQLQQNIQWTQRGNFIDVPTDCPQRDERLGWVGDAQLFAPTAAFNFNVAPFFTKWLLDLAKDQLPNGMVTYVVPDVLMGKRGGSAAWSDASVIIPWTVYQAYGDTGILVKQYPSMKAWIEYVRQRAGEDCLWTGDFQYGDWLSFATTLPDYPGATTDKDLIATAYYAFSTDRLAKIAALLGKIEDARKYSNLALKIRNAFQKEYITPAGRIVSNTQTAYAIALTFGLIPDTLVSKAAGYLAEDVGKMKHLTTGLVGTPLLCKALSDHGYADLAFMLLIRKEYPSFLYPVTLGATTIWERWDGQKPDGSFQDQGMNSFNHYALGSIGEWLYSYVTGIGIDQKNPGYKHFFLQPHQGGGLTFANAELKTLFGIIKSGWKLEDGQILYSCSVPPNTSATVCFDNVNVQNITINKLPLQNDLSVQFVESDEKVKIEIGSGNYLFTLPLR